MGEPLQSPRLLLRPPTEQDLDALARVLREPEVSRWWPGFDAARVRAELLEPDPDVTVFALEHAGQVVGAIQFGEVTDPMYRHASIDLFLSARCWGAGLGPEAIITLARHLFEARGHHRIVIDPAADNARAIRAYEKVGFRRVGTMRRYERGADGTWHDGLLMELLAEDGQLLPGPPDNSP
jgi:aminoglycoside 6'-N-acetyltransferase